MNADKHRFGALTLQTGALVGGYLKTSRVRDRRSNVYSFLPHPFVARPALRNSWHSLILLTN